MYKVLTIAGSDSCCGAGVQADLKVISALGAYGTCAITAITAQNTLGVSSVFNVPASVVGQQIDAVVSDIGADSLKTGMLVSENVVAVVCDMLRKYSLKNLVVDPVITSHMGRRLLSEEGVMILVSDLIPLSCLVTPNIPEAEILTGRKIKSLSDTKDAASALFEQGASNVLIKGGHIMDHGDGKDDETNGEIIDLFYDGKEFQYFREKRINTDNVHGTGCMYSAAIATGLAKGNDMISSIIVARKFITKTIKESSMPGKGNRLADFTYQTGE
ncbi:MAG: bifunctional hydroxymethylpyrimidine kinase/phosphomethylpyrimidine kinase [Candidatus Scalindua rubra]|uniref:hydroxymethylpyrimidine kinase n=1 Tax=Candidatus Scalindua brodae TaxID=237368 RepID=A0A0B0EJX2_9BACT|nr:MAG: phosphomethylpyrimidine kinase [Candidatus Scalindua brodae]MBZ0108567.1 bifunctional hydroxymethylpyrimidine kinase/phosphomethylpyrimidine kinase [Candidatus Scalindua rubra]TWU38136.1 Hydroxymethylpyrimidine/phosphomethylpyrimidine kinase [Candidatus Brocadiaceae bacterium S225]